MTASRRRTLLAGCAAAVIGAVTLGTGLAGAQTPSTPTTAPDVSSTAPATTALDDVLAPEPISITAVSPWVDPNGDFQVRFTAADSVSPAAKVTWTVHQRLTASRSTTLRQQVERALDGAPLGRVLQAPDTRTLAELGDAGGGLSIDVPLRSNRSVPDRLLLTEPGPYPVEMVLLSPDGPELWRRTVILNRLPEAMPVNTSGAKLTLQASLLLPIDSGPALSVNGRGTFDQATRARLQRVHSLLDHRADTPFTLAARGNTVSGLGRSDEAWAKELDATIRNPTTSARPVLLPYIATATGGLVAEDAAPQLAGEVDLGRRIVSTTTGQSVESTTWVLDDFLTPQALSALHAGGITSVVADPSRVKTANANDRAVLRTAALAVNDVSGTRVMTTDPDLSKLLAGETSTPAFRAHAVLSGMVASWFTAAGAPTNERTNPASVVVVDPATDPTVLDTLVPALLGGGPLSSDPSRPMVPAIDSFRKASATLAPEDSNDQGAAVLGSIGSTQLIDGYRSMVGQVDPALDTWTELNAQSLYQGLPGSQRTALHVAIKRDVANRAARINAPPNRSVVLTSSKSTVPLRFRNRLPYRARVLLRIRAPRLAIVGGRNRTVTLSPGNNRVDLEVRSRAPGQSVLRIETSSPDGHVSIASSAISVRSSTISGVGAALSLLSLLFLLAWWVSASRRRRRHDARTTGRHPTATDDDGVSPHEDPVTAGNDDARFHEEPTNEQGPTGTVAPSG